jgi:phosphoribosylformylglycinamidine synthase subunit PurL
MMNKDIEHSDSIKAFLTSDELHSIEKLLGRTASSFELNMFAAMWSEHISYKSSIKWIEEMPVDGNRVHIAAGEENAGVIDLGNGLACVIKMESHNHPTAMNPGEAAVGVGNVFRDIIAMGARPVAHLNILRYGIPMEDKTRASFSQVISALGSYSNNFGVPVVGGEVLFDDSYTHNPLLNLMAVGLVEKEKIVKASFKENGNCLYLIGRKTSGSGVHGAGFASKAFSKTMEHLIPETQMADPCAGKILFDCIMEMNQHGIIRSMQDVGAGGVLCAASEMAHRGQKGVELRLEKIPVSRDDLDPTEIMLSQSQEQMLITLRPGDVDQFNTIADKWEIFFAKVGEVTNDKRIKVHYNSEKLGDLPVSFLVRGGGAPVYIRNMKTPERKIVKVTAEEVPFPGSLKEVAKTMIKLPNISSRKWIYEQFDTLSGLSNISSEYASDAGIVHLPGQDQLLAISVDGNSRYVRKEPRQGAMIAVAEASRNIICSGGSPLALANGLNFGDPGNLHVYYDFTESVKGIKQICGKMELPVIAGNVSFNNFSRIGEEAVSVQPTPVIGMVGVIDRAEDVMTVSFQSKGDMIYLVGKSDNDLSASEYLAAIHLIEETAAPELDLDIELKVQAVVKEIIRKLYVSSAHDVSLGGLFIALVECCLANSLGFDITPPAEVREDAFLFGEAQSRIVVSVSPKQETDFLDFMMEQNLPFSALGHVTKEELRVDDTSFGFIADYARDFEESLGKMLEGSSSE